MPDFTDHVLQTQRVCAAAVDCASLARHGIFKSFCAPDAPDGVAARFALLSLLIPPGRYDELKGAAALECAACAEYFAGLVVDGSALTLDAAVIASAPFTTFAEARARERERELQFMTGDICGSGWAKRPGHTMCALHTSQIPVEARAGLLCWQGGGWQCLRAARCKPAVLYSAGASWSVTLRMEQPRPASQCCRGAKCKRKQGRPDCADLCRPAGAGGVLGEPGGGAHQRAVPPARGGLCGGAGRAPEVPAAHLSRLPRQCAQVHAAHAPSRLLGLGMASWVCMGLHIPWVQARFVMISRLAYQVTWLLSFYWSPFSKCASLPEGSVSRPPWRLGVYERLG